MNDKHHAHPYPRLETPRLVLRPFAQADAAEVQRLAGDPRVAATTLNIPHPYEDGMAQAWIDTHQAGWTEREELTLAITLCAAAALVGSISLMNVDRSHQHAELGYWVGVPYWGNGYCTEAARAVVGYAFEAMGLHRVHAHHFAGNRGSGKVMRNIGMRHEGHLRRHIRKGGQYLDIEMYGILAEDWPAAVRDA